MTAPTTVARSNSSNDDVAPSEAEAFQKAPEADDDDVPPINIDELIKVCLRLSANCIDT